MLQEVLVHETFWWVMEAYIKEVYIAFDVNVA